MLKPSRQQGASLELHLAFLSLPITMFPHVVHVIVICVFGAFAWQDVMRDDDTCSTEACKETVSMIQSRPYSQREVLSTRALPGGLCNPDFGILTSNVCCAKSCGSCGGDGCSGLPGGGALCCHGAIKKSGSVCAKADDVGCVVTSTTTTSTSASTTTSTATTTTTSTVTTSTSTTTTTTTSTMTTTTTSTTSTTTTASTTTTVSKGGARWGEKLVQDVLAKINLVFKKPQTVAKSLLGDDLYECQKRTGSTTSDCSTNSRGERNIPSAAYPSAPRFLRLGFHDCARYSDHTGGCDGCLNLEGAFNAYPTASELKHDPLPNGASDSNNNLALSADVLEAIYTRKNFPAGSPKLEQSLASGGQSRADLWALATLAAAAKGLENNEENCGKRSRNIYKAIGLKEMCLMRPSRPLRFFSGRADCPQAIKPRLNDTSKFYRRRSYETDMRENLGQSHAGGNVLQKYFDDSFNFTVRETVAIMGAHSFGSFNSGVSLFKYTWKRATDNYLNNEYYRIIALKRHYNKQMKPDGWHVVGGPGRSESNWAGELAQTRWEVRNHKSMTGGGPFQWAHQYKRGPDCQLQEDGSWVAVGLGNEGSSAFRSPRCCRENLKQPEDPTIDPKCFDWVSQDEEALAVDAGLYLDFSSDNVTGRPLGCNFRDPNKQNWKNTAVNCPLQKIKSKDGREPTMMYQIVEQYADDQNIWINDFIAALEKMVSNGAGSLHLESDIPTPGVQSAL